MASRARLPRLRRSRRAWHSGVARCAWRCTSKSRPRFWWTVSPAAGFAATVRPAFTRSSIRPERPVRATIATASCTSAPTTSATWSAIGSPCTCATRYPWSSVTRTGESCGESTETSPLSVSRPVCDRRSRRISLSPRKTPVQVGSLTGDCRPRKLALYALTPGLRHALAQVRLAKQAVDGGRQVRTEPARVERLEGTLGLLFQRDEHTRYAVDYDLGDTPDLAGDHWCAAGHCLQVDDAEWLVDRRTAKHGGVAVELDDLVARKHLLDPDHVAALALRVGDGLLHLGRDLGRVGRPRAQDHLSRTIDIGNGAGEINDALLAGNAADEQDHGPPGIDAKAPECVRRFDRPVELRIDAVVDDVHALGPNRRHAQNVVKGPAGDGDDRVRHAERSLLDPARQVVATAQLLAFPRTERLERVHGDDQRDAVALSDEDAAQVAVPGVAVDHVRVHPVARPGHVARHSPEYRPQVARRRHAARLGVAADAQATVVQPLVAEAPHLHVHQPCQPAAQELNVHAGAAVHVGRVFVGQQQRLHPVTAATPRLRRWMPSRMRSGLALE